MTNKQSEYYVLFIWGGTEPEIHGPYEDAAKRDTEAIKLLKKDIEHSVFGMDIENGIPNIWAYLNH